jgi:hypothetical protein
MSKDEAQDMEITEDLDVQPEEADAVKGGIMMEKQRTFNDGKHKGTDGHHLGSNVI